MDQIGNDASSKSDCPYPNEDRFFIKNNCKDPRLSGYSIVAKRISGSVGPKILVNLWKRPIKSSIDEKKEDVPLCEHTFQEDTIKDWTIEEREWNSSIFCPICQETEDENRIKIELIPISIEDTHLFVESLNNVKSRNVSQLNIDENIIPTLNRGFERISFKRKEKEQTEKNLVKDLLNTERVAKFLEKGETLKSVIREFSDLLDDKCPKDTDDIKLGRTLGSGASGKVFKAELSTKFKKLGVTSVAVKEVEDYNILDEDTLTLSIHVGGKLGQLKLHTFDVYLNETIISSLMNRFVQPNAKIEDACPNFPLFYGFFTCEERISKQTLPLQEKKSSGFTIFELFDGNIPAVYDPSNADSRSRFFSFLDTMENIVVGSPTKMKFVPEKLMGNSPFSGSRIGYTLRYIYFQVVFAIAKAQDDIKFVHNDLHVGNIMIKKIKKGDKWQKQELDQATTFLYTMKGEVSTGSEN